MDNFVKKKKNKLPEHQLVMELADPNGSISILKYVTSMDKVISLKWYSVITFVIYKSFRFSIEILVNFRADLNCINKGVVPTKYFWKTSQDLQIATDQLMKIQYKVSGAALIQDKVCFETPFVWLKDEAMLWF